MVRLPAAVIIACALLLSACDRTSSDFESEITKAEAYVGVGEADKALYAYRDIADRYADDGRWAGVMLRISELYSTVFADAKSAEEALSKVLDRAPLTEAGRLARLARAGLRESHGDYAGAIEDYTAYLKHFPEHEGAMRARLMLAGVYLTAGDFRQSRVEVKPLVEGKNVPEDVREKALFVGAESFFLEGNVRRASSYYRWLIKDFPDSALVPEAKLHLASCIEEMGYLGIAKDVTRDAAKDYPNKGVIEARLESIDERGTKSAGEMFDEVGAPEAKGGEETKTVYKEGGLN